MLRVAWPQVRSDLVSIRRGAGVFLDNLGTIYGATSRQNWVKQWTSIGDAHCLVGDEENKSAAFNEAKEAWLCALTAFEVARRLVDRNDPQSGDVSAKVEASIQKFPSLERVQVSCSDQTEILAYYLRADGSDLCCPAVICITREDESAAILLGRLLPVAIGRRISIFVLSHADVSNQWRGHAEAILSCCLDYLSARPEVDVARIGVYGEGLSAALATKLAASDLRVAAAVCDGGLWNWTWTLASVGWITGTAEVMDEEVLRARRSRLVQQLRCPALVVAGGRGVVDAWEAIKLRCDCVAARVDLELAMPRTILTPLGEIENFVTSDDCIFAWLEQKLTRTSAR